MTNRIVQVAWSHKIVKATTTKLLNAKKDARHRARLRFSGVRTTKRIRLSQNFTISTLYIPAQFECVIFQTIQKEILICLYGTLYNVKLPIYRKHKAVFFDNESRVLCVKHQLISAFHHIHQQMVELMLTSIVQLFFCKIKFKGKGYKLAKSRQRRTLVFQFGHSHKILEYTFLISIKSVLKQALIFYGINNIDVRQTAANVRRWRSLNIYTGRGIRFTRQLVYRKAGKIKAYK